MKIARFFENDTEQWGFVNAEVVHPVEDVRMIDALADRHLLSRLHDDAIDKRPLDAVTLLAPLPHPPQFIGVGLNYRAHAEEAGMGIPQSPVTFPFYTTAIVGPGEAIRIPHFTDAVDWEAELAIVIGAGGRDLTTDEALDTVAGYTIVNDVSARDIQVADGQWSRAKSFDSFKPMGPWIVSVDELGDAASLEITLNVNGVVKQSSSTSDLIFTVPELVSMISRGTTLLPGAVISTGTPSGVGMSRTPAEYLCRGDVVSISIEGIGELENRVTGSDSA